MNADAEYAAHQREYDDAMRRIAEANAWLAQWEADCGLTPDETAAAEDDTP